MSWLLQFLIRLQSEDYIAANQIQKELEKLLPGDPTIQAFADYLPAEAKWQTQVLEENGDDDEQSYYDEEEDDEDEEEEPGEENDGEGIDAEQAGDT